eukprot:15481915-Alexandrium_andersonii.AAC.1
MPTLPDEALQGGICSRFRPPSWGRGLPTSRWLRIATGLGARPDRRTTDYSGAQEDARGPLRDNSQGIKLSCF